jgi:hypothetical protein
MLSKEFGILKIAARHNIRSISFCGPENEKDARWFAIYMMSEEQLALRDSISIVRTADSSY